MKINKQTNKQNKRISYETFDCHAFDVRCIYIIFLERT